MPQVQGKRDVAGSRLWISRFACLTKNRRHERPKLQAITVAEDASNPPRVKPDLSLLSRHNRGGRAQPDANQDSPVPYLAQLPRTGGPTADLFAPFPDVDRDVFGLPLRVKRF